jgi:hypothetical protein
MKEAALRVSRSLRPTIQLFGLVGELSWVMGIGSDYSVNYLRLSNYLMKTLTNFLETYPLRLGNSETKIVSALPEYPA